MAKKYIVDLSKDEKAELVSLTQKGRPGARKIKRANILLLVDSGKPDFEVAELLHTSWLTVLRTRQRYVEGGLDFALNELPRAGRLPKIDDKIETILTTLAQSHPPNGRVRWTLQLLADRLVALTRFSGLSAATGCHTPMDGWFPTETLLSPGQVSFYYAHAGTLYPSCSANPTRMPSGPRM
jgi:transposase